MLNNSPHHQKQHQQYRPTMGTHRASNLERQMSQLDQFVSSLKERTGRKGKIRDKGSTYGKLSETTRWFAVDKPAASLTTSTMSNEQQQELLANQTSAVSRDEQMKRVGRNSYSPPAEKGIWLK